MIRLLNPIITDIESLKALVENAKDIRWTDDSLREPLESGLQMNMIDFLALLLG
jgi:hypothetical protein